MKTFGRVLLAPVLVALVVAGGLLARGLYVWWML